MEHKCFITHMSQRNLLQVKDHSVSGETFRLVYNAKYDMYETQPQPDQNEIGRYYASENYISHTDARRNLFEMVYQKAKAIMLKKKAGLIQELRPSPGAILDVGCGTGDFLKYCRLKGWKAFGIEPNEKARTLAIKKNDEGVYGVDGMSKFRENTFDIITLWHVLEHLHDLKSQISIYRKILKKDGRIVVAVPNYCSYDAAYYGSFWAGFDVPRHLWHFSKRAITNLFEEQGFEVLSHHPMPFDAYYVSLLSESYKGHSAMSKIRAMYIGWKSNLKARKSGEYSSLIYVIGPKT